MHIYIATETGRKIAKASGYSNDEEMKVLQYIAGCGSGGASDSDAPVERSGYTVKHLIRQGLVKELSGERV